MTIGSHISTFNNLNIEKFNKNVGIQDASKAIRLEVDYDDAEAGAEILEVTTAFLNDPKAATVTSLVIGVWEDSYDVSIQTTIDSIIEHASKLPALKAIFFGDITYDQSEISWIMQGNYSAFWRAFPELEHFQVRGSTSLSLGTVHHANLKTLIVECGGLPQQILTDLQNSQLPALTKLELWLGSDDYGWDSKAGDVLPLLNQELFPSLTHLGLKDSIVADDIAAVLTGSGFIKHLKVLDLSLGALGDKGAEALLACKEIESLDFLNLNYHFISDAMQAKLKAIDIKIDLSDPQEEEKYDGETYRYISVAE